MEVPSQNPEKSIVQAEVNANEQQKLRSDKKGLEKVSVEAKTKERLPTEITRLGKEKVEFLIKGIGQLRKGMKTLEIFGGSGLSTAVLGHVVGEKNLTTIDLRYSISSKSDWRYNTRENYKSETKSKKLDAALPVFITADATRLPIADEVFDVIVAPDPPRELKSLPNKELSDEYRRLFTNTAKETLRALKDGGIFVATAPLLWARDLKNVGFEKVQIFSSENHGDDITVITIGRSLQFKTKGVEDPVVYIRCIK